MHIVDGPLSPEVCLGTGLLAAGAVGYSIHRLKDGLADRTVPLTGMMSALVFAGQMVNFPLIGAPVSGHLIGGVLAAVILGPWAGCLAITLVLMVQCLLFYDGGFSALGANILNMGVVGSIGGYAVYAVCRRFIGRGVGSTVVAAVVASWLSVMAAAFLFCIEFRLFHGSSDLDFGKVFALMVSFHSLIGIGEALITGTVISFVVRQRPDLIYSPDEHTSGTLAGAGRFVTAGCIAAMAVAAFVAPFASGHPDGLEAVAHETEFDSLQADFPALLLDEYAIPSPVEGWQESMLWQRLSVSLAGILGTVSVFVMAIGFGNALKPLATPAGAGHAE